MVLGRFGAIFFKLDLFILKLLSLSVYKKKYLCLCFHLMNQWVLLYNYHPQNNYSKFALICFKICFLMLIIGNRYKWNELDIFLFIINFGHHVVIFLCVSVLELNSYPDLNKGTDPHTPSKYSKMVVIIQIIVILLT